MTDQLRMLRIEIDGHFHGSPDVPRPWVAEITGTDPTYGLARTFVRSMNDWKEAHRAMSGNIYGTVATFALRTGRLYEVARLEGNPSKRRMVRRFRRVEARAMPEIDPVDALAIADGGGGAAVLRVDESADPKTTWVARVRGLGTPERLGYVLVGGRRAYRLRDGLHEVVESGQQGFAIVEAGAARRVSEKEALAWIR